MFYQSVSDALIQAQKVGEETKQAATKEAEAVLSKHKYKLTVL